MAKKPSKHPGGKYTAMLLSTMNTDAWRSLSTSAQALYPWLRMEWKGAQYNNNGKLSLSYRAAAEAMGISSPDTVMRAFKDLQAKGFVVVHKVSSLGVEGMGRSFEYEITDLDMPGKTNANKLFLQWRKGHDFPVVDGQTGNPVGKNERNKKQNPIPKIGTVLSQKSGQFDRSYPNNRDTLSQNSGQFGPSEVQAYPKNRDILMSLPRSAAPEEQAKPRPANPKGKGGGERVQSTEPSKPPHGGTVSEKSQAAIEAFAKRMKENKEADKCLLK
ncbi:MAG: hypothetical protein KDJ63_09215 [Nitratireductor sp.]|nr:hypothetical protein [Nitratireductor sp.]